MKEIYKHEASLKKQFVWPDDLRSPNDGFVSPGQDL